MRTCIVLLSAVLAGCSATSIRRGPLDPGLNALIPSDTVLLAGIRMDLVRASPVYAKLQLQNRLMGFPDIAAGAGFNLERDVHDVLIASDGKNALAVARGEFTGKRPSNLESQPYKGHAMFLKNERESLAFLDDHLVVAGPVATVHAAIDQWSRHAHAIPREVLERVRALPADAQIWAVAAGWKGASPGSLREMGNAANLDRLLRSVEGASVTVDLRTGAHVAATGDCRTEAEAQSLSESIRGLAAMARLGVPKDRPELLHAFDGIQVRQEGRAMKLNIDISEDLAEKLLKF